MSPTFQIDVFHGQLSPNTAQVYAKVDGLPGGQEWTITGRLRGPDCRHSKTLPTNHAFVDLGAGKTLLARATLVDPCFWSPELPALYRVTLELRQGNAIVQTAERDLGLRFFGTRGSSFYLEGKRWVLRGVSRECVGETPLAEWRDDSAAMLVDNPTDELCQEASREGVILVACLRGGDLAALRRLSQWASVGIVISSAPSQVLSEARRQLPNVILAQFASAGRGDHFPESCSVICMDAAALISQGSIYTTRSVPLIAVRRLGEMLSLAEARDACDRLQGDLAHLGDFAGYVVDFTPNR